MATSRTIFRPCLQTLEERLPLSLSLPLLQSNGNFPPGQFPSGNPATAPGIDFGNSVQSTTTVSSYIKIPMDSVIISG